MKICRIKVFAVAAVMCATPPFHEATAFTSSLAESKDRTQAFVHSGQPKSSGYNDTLVQLILTEIQRTEIPFAIASPFTFLVRFDLNRGGQLVALKLLKASNLSEANEYAELIVRRASRNFPPLPPDIPGERVGFIVPLAMVIRAPSGEIIYPQRDAGHGGPPRSPARGHGR